MKWRATVDVTWEFDVEAEDEAQAEDVALDQAQGDYAWPFKPEHISISVAREEAP